MRVPQQILHFSNSLNKSYVPTHSSSRSWGFRKRKDQTTRLRTQHDRESTPTVGTPFLLTQRILGGTVFVQGNTEFEIKYEGEERGIVLVLLER